MADLRNFVALMLVAVSLPLTSSSVRPEYVCHKCVCTVVPDKGSEYLDVVCDSTLSLKASLDLFDFSEATKTRSLRIENYPRVRLGVGALGLDAKIFVRNVMSLRLDSWVDGAVYSISGVGQLSFGETTSKPHLKSVKLRNVSIPVIPTGALSFASVTSKFILDTVNIGDIERKGIVLPMDFNSTFFLLGDSKITGKVSPGAGIVRAATVVVTNSSFVPEAAAGLRLTASKKIIVSNSKFHQTRKSDFLDVFSPVIVLVNNTFMHPLNV